MADPRQLAIVEGGSKAWNAWRSEHPRERVDLTGAKLSSASLPAVNFDGAVLDVSHLEDADLTGSRLQNASLSSSHLDRAQLSGANCTKAVMKGAVLTSAVLSRAFMRESRLDSARIDHATMDGADLTGANLTRASGVGATLTDARLVRSNLSNANLSKADLSRADLSDADLRGANLSDARLVGTNLRGAVVDDHTLLSNATVDGCAVERYTLERMKGHGGLTPAQRMTMRVEDPVLELRSHYGGVWRTLHFLALLLFLFPYISFLAQQYLLARFAPPTDATSTVGAALLRYIVTGGTGSTVAWLPLAIFVYSLIYNGLRVALLLKAQSFELYEQVTGLPPAFPSTGCWRTAWRLAIVMFFGNLILVAIHTWHFLGMRVPHDW